MVLADPALKGNEITAPADNMHDSYVFATAGKQAYNGERFDAALKQNMRKSFSTT